MRFFEFFTYPYILICGLSCLILYLYILNKRKNHIIWWEELHNLNNKQTLSALAILTQLIAKYQYNPTKRKEDLFCQIVKKTVDLFAFECAVIYSKGFEILSGSGQNSEQTSDVLHLLETKKLELLKIFQDKTAVVEVIENKESKKYIYILKLIDEQHPHFVAFIQKLSIPPSKEGLQINYYKLQQSFIPMTQDILNSSIRSLLLYSIKEKFYEDAN